MWVPVVLLVCLDWSKCLIDVGRDRERKTCRDKPDIITQLEDKEK